VPIGPGNSAAVAPEKPARKRGAIRLIGLS